MSITKIMIQDRMFVLTGRMWKGRTQIIFDIEQCGGAVMGRVTSRVDYLVLGNNIKIESKKHRDARALGIDIIKEGTLKYNLDYWRSSQIIHNSLNKTERLVKTDKTVIGITAGGQMVVLNNKRQLEPANPSNINNNPVFGIVTNIDKSTGIATVAMTGGSNDVAQSLDIRDPTQTILGSRPTMMIVDDVEEHIEKAKEAKPLTERQKVRLTNTLDRIGNEFEEIDRLLDIDRKQKS